VNVDRRAELERLLLDSDSLIADFFDKSPEPEDDLEDLIADDRADAASRFDPALHGLRNSQYIVRIRRDDGDDLRIDGPSVRDVMDGIEAEVDAAAPSARDEVRIELDSLTRGSVVLHYRAVRPLAAVNEGEFDHGLSVVDSAISHVADLHRAIERAAPVGQIVKIANSTELLGASKVLLERLQKNELNISTRWRNARGERVSSKLTTAAKDHAALLFQKSPVDNVIPISGLVISISLDGKFVIKAGRQYEVAASDDTADLVARNVIRLGETLHLILKEEVSKDRVGLKSKPKYTLVRLDETLFR
jgi:hypothetical protein